MTGPTSSSKKPRTAIFTIAAGNYLHFVRTLMAHVAIHAPEADRWLGLCDTVDKATLAGENFQVMTLGEIPLPDARTFIYQYTLLELSTAIKPFIIEQLALKHGYDRVIYFDPDIGIFDSLNHLHALLNDHEVVLTPHITEGYRDNRRPSDREILQCGTYNLGFAAFRWTEKTAAFVRWWQKKLTHDCVVDFPRGLFVDQKWMEFAPSFVPNTHICHHPGWNVAYWNLPSRDVTSNGLSTTVNGQPLFFYHFSGFNPERGTFSGYQDRYTLDNLPAAVKSLAATYADELRKNGYPETTRQRCALNYFSTGVKIPDGARRIFREHYAALYQKFPDPSGADAAALIHYVNAPAEKHGKSAACVTRLAYDFYQHGPDLALQEQFPDALGLHAEAFASWLLEAGDMTGFDDVFLQPIRQALGRNNQNAAPAAPGFSASKWLYKQAWKFKHLTHWMLPLPVRQRIHGWMFNRAYVKAKPGPGASSDKAALRDQPLGINLIGYLQAELGVGEAARATMRAAKAVNIPISLIDFRKGVASRMGEVIDPDHVKAPVHPINILHINADQLPYAVAEHNDQLQGRYNIGFWNWELPEFPDEWMESFHFLDELWAPSAFCHQAFAAKSPIPVCHIPYCINIEAPENIKRPDLGLPEDAFIFLFMFDVLSVPERKNPSALLKAYQQAKSRFNRKTALVVKMINTKTEHPLLDEMRAAAAADSSIILIEQYLDRPKLNALFNVVDCYVSLHRSEGFGLTLAESMYLGKPVIGTGWSSTTDFMTPWNSYMVRYKLIPIEKDYGPYKKGQLWADPDIDDATDCMVKVVNDPEDAKLRAKRGQETIKTEFSPEAVGRRILARISAIGFKQI
jgi:glycosyltransferase involved in cell wall biosynthesis